ncbi:RNA-binding protein 41 isoform X2 [Tiliqua scincoides]|uniref:RNA-binding protein 41 isoform X2 n=1 Tax=Tiliqua scincoides TaxID=71010 RepID=UPI0034623E8C
MRRVSSGPGGDDALPEGLETEGERQLQSLLRRQLDTAVPAERCVAKRRCFAPAALYKPFGEEAAGVRSLPQFQALQESGREAASLRELGLSDPEIRLWRNQAAAEKGAGLGAAPDAQQHRLEAIQEKIAERQRILALPQRFAGSKVLSRREMEIERALFQGTDRHAFLRGLYHQEPVEFVPEEEIRKNRLSEEELRQIPRFSSYSHGEPSEVLYLKNLGPRVTVKDLVALFARFQEEGGPQIRFRLLHGRMRGQAFLTFPSLSAAQAALQLVNGFRLQGKPLVIEFGHRKAQAGSPSSEPAPNPGNSAVP